MEVVMLKEISNSENAYPTRGGGKDKPLNSASDFQKYANSILRSRIDDG
jgi:hypothetical protein